jgi:WD40 repeat protein
MMDARLFHTGTLLDSGAVLVAGGSQIAGTLDAAEVYDPATRRFTATAGAMLQARHHHTATLLNDGTVLIAGGDNGGGVLVATAFASAELYDPATNKFKATGAMFAPRTWHTATVLSDGKVLVAGGSPAVDSTIDPDTGNATGLPIGALANGELYDSSSDQFFGNPGAMNDARTEHAAALIKNCGCSKENQVLLAGGIDASGTTLTSAELFDERSNSFTVTGSMNIPRHNHTATTLQDGRVLITGGVDNSLNLLDSAEIYDPTTGAFTLTAPMNEARAFHTAQLLDDGRVLVAGGSGDNSAEIFNPSTGKFTLTAGAMKAVRFVQTATILNSGGVLIAGGALLLSPTGELFPSSSLRSAEVFSPSAGTFASTAQPMLHSRVAQAATALNDGRVLITGGEDLTTQIFNNAELYNSDSGAFSCVGGVAGGDCAASLHQDRFSHTATPLAGSSLVLIAGGSDGTTVGTPPNDVLAGIATAEIYHASSKTFSCVGGVSATPPVCNNSMVDGRYNHVAVGLLNGKVLIAGGIDADGNVTDTAELYDPAKGVFVATGAMTSTREEFAAALFNSGPLAGQVLVSGGTDQAGNFLDSAELYDPASGKFTATGSMAESRFLQSATLLDSGPNAGDILIAGGSGDQSAELYDPKTRSFKRAGDMTQIVFSPIVNTLGSGELLLAGGATFNSVGQIVPVSGTELYDPATNRFTAADDMTTARWLAVGAFLDPAVVSSSKNGDVLVAGGLGVNSPLSSSELFVPATSTTAASASAALPAAMSPAAKRQEVAQAMTALHTQLRPHPGGGFGGVHP